MNRMATNGMATGAGGLRAIRQELAGARDDQISRVVAMLDAMPERGEADRLIAPLRGRLARMGVERRMSFTRLLFLPLDPVVMPAPDWRRGAPGLPRSALPALAEAVRAGLGAACGEVEAALEGVTARQGAAVLAAGRLLWGPAARVLAEAPAPAGWSGRTGLQERDFLALARPCASVLRQAVPLHATLARLGLGEDADPALLQAMLREAAAAGEAHFAVLVAVLLARLPGCAALLALVDELAPAGPARLAADEAVGFVLERMEVTADSSLARVTAALAADQALLQGLEARAAQRPSRLAQVSAVRQRLAGACRGRFASELPARLLEPAVRLAAADDSEMEGLEAAARELRHFGQAAGRFGQPEHYENALRQAASALRPQDGDGPQTLADRVRLTEILAGPEAALALLGG